MVRQRWPVCHPRIFKSHLLHELTEADFKNGRSEWLQKATDRPFMFNFLERSGDARSQFMKERKIYNYTWTKNNGRSGQWIDLKKIKNKAFKDFGYLSCSK
tara:strand:- start:1006 stop:1308 length:303 start_codon:yes stop_codon:yes gene_type:complete